jgi:hypothetical protein
MLHPIAERYSNTAQPRLITFIVLVDFVLMLAPPLHWHFGNGSATQALTYFLGSSLLVTLSLALISACSNQEGE